MHVFVLRSCVSALIRHAMKTGFKVLYLSPASLPVEYESSHVRSMSCMRSYAFRVLVALLALFFHHLCFLGFPAKNATSHDPETRHDCRACLLTTLVHLRATANASRFS